MNYNQTHKIVDGEEYKLCGQCGNWALLDRYSFGVNKGNKDGYNSKCRVCQKKNNQEYYKHNREHLLKKSKDRINEIDAKEIAVYKHKWYRDNKDIRTAYSRNYKSTRREHYNNLSRNYRKSERGLIKFRQYSAKRNKEKTHQIRDQEWICCKEYFENNLSQYCCAYCGMTEEEHINKLNKGLHREHVIYNGKNDLSNCVPSCLWCNTNKQLDSLNKWYNNNNKNYTYEKYYKIYMWIRYDYKKYILPKNKYKGQNLNMRLNEIDNNKYNKPIKKAK